jgi:large subunit ribosomal protein L13
LSASGAVYVDATNQVAGRLASNVAKLLLSGQKVFVVNSERALLSGAREAVMSEWRTKLELSSRVNPIYGPIHPRRPDTILRRMVRGMVPRKKPKGQLAMKRLRVYVGVPSDLKEKKLTQFEDAAATRPIPIYVTMLELSKNMGWSG